MTYKAVLASEKREDIIKAIQDKDLPRVISLARRFAIVGTEHIEYRHVFLVAVYSGHAGIVDFFLKNDRDGLLVEKFATCLIEAVRSQNAGVVDALLKHGFDPLQKEPTGTNARAIAYAMGLDEIIPLIEDSIKSRASEREGWQKVSDDVISFIVHDKEQGSTITDTFNFASGTHMTVVRALDIQDVKLHLFCNMADMTYVKKAAEELRSRSGNDHLDGISRLRPGISEIKR